MTGPPSRLLVLSSDAPGPLPNVTSIAIAISGRKVNAVVEAPNKRVSSWQVAIAMTSQLWLRSCKYSRQIVNAATEERLSSALPATRWLFSFWRG